MAELSRQEREERIRQIDAMLRMLKAQDAVDLVETPSPEAVADYSPDPLPIRPRDMRSANTPVGDALGHYVHPSIGLAGSMAENASDAVTSVPLTEDGGSGLQRAAFAAAPGLLVTKAGKGAMAVAKPIGDFLSKALSKQGARKTLGVTGVVAPVAGAGIDAAREAAYGPEHRLLGDNWGTSGMVATGLAGGALLGAKGSQIGGRAAKAMADDVAKSVDIRKAGDLFPEGRIEQAPLPKVQNVRSGRKSPYWNKQTGKDDNSHGLELPEPTQAEFAKAFAGPEKARDAFDNLITLDDKVRRKAMPTVRHPVTKKPLKKDVALNLMRAEYELAMTGKVPNWLRKSLKSEGIDLPGKSARNWQKRLGSTIRPESARLKPAPQSEIGNYEAERAIKRFNLMTKMLRDGAKKPKDAGNK